jgi:hypothetical protein
MSRFFTPATRSQDVSQDILQDLSDIAEYLREQAGGTIQPIDNYARDYAHQAQEDASQYGSYEAYSRQYDALSGAKGGLR